MELECPCLIADEKKNCIDCGKPIESPEFTVARIGPPLPPDAVISDLGNIVAIAKLAQETIAEYDQRAHENEDQKNPKLPRLRFIGGSFFRIPFLTMWNETVAPSFFHAKRLGFRGNYTRWCEMVKESRQCGIPCPVCSTVRPPDETCPKCGFITVSQDVLGRG